jgi:hypothetical protein
MSLKMYKIIYTREAKTTIDKLTLKKKHQINEECRMGSSLRLTLACDKGFL